jgi:hypothetical protein
MLRVVIFSLVFFFCFFGVPCARGRSDTAPGPDSLPGTRFVFTPLANPKSPISSYAHSPLREEDHLPGSLVMQ